MVVSHAAHNEHRLTTDTVLIREEPNCNPN